MKSEAVLFTEGLTLVSIRVELKILSTRATDQVLVIHPLVLCVLFSAV